MIIEIDYDLQS